MSDSKNEAEKKNGVLDVEIDGIESLCLHLQDEVMAPAMEEAASTIEEARSEARKILKDARQKADEILLKGKEELANRERALRVAMEGAKEHALEQVKEAVETLFSQQLTGILNEEFQEKTDHVCEWISQLILKIPGELLDAPVLVNMPKEENAHKMARSVLAEVLPKLDGKELLLRGVSDRCVGGVMLCFTQNGITIDLSPESLESMFFRHIRRDLRGLLFEDEEKDKTTSIPHPGKSTVEDGS